MLRFLLALCAVLFTACATAPPSPTEVPMETPRWVSGELMVNFTVEPFPLVKLCVGPCDVKLQLMGRIKDGTSTLLYMVPDGRALRYDEIHVVPKQEPNGFRHWLVYAVSRDFGNIGCTRWFLATPAQEEGGDIRPEGNHFQVVEVQSEHEEGCDPQIKPESEDTWMPDDWKPHSKEP